MSEMLELAEYCERLEGPSGEVDLAIATWCYRNGAVAGVNYDPVLWIERNGGEFTGSMDQAMALVPEGWSWIGGHSPTQKSAMAVCPDGEVDGASGVASTPALALCTAALRARHHLENSDAQG